MNKDNQTMAAAPISSGKKFMWNILHFSLWLVVAFLVFCSISLMFAKVWSAAFPILFATIPPIEFIEWVKVKKTGGKILLAPLRTSADYLPKMGGGDEVDLAGFSALYGADPLYHWMGLDSPLMFAAHKAAGGMTSIYRQLGIGCERLFRAVLKDELALNEEQVKWSYEILPETEDDTKKPRVLSLDGRVEVSDVHDSQASQRVARWVKEQQAALKISVPLKGAVFEVRQGYKSADSKRQNADLANAAQAIGHGYLPVLTIMSTQINHVVRARYLTGNWCVLMGTVGADDPHTSTFDFLRSVVGYDLAAFFERNTAELRAGFEGILSQLLEAK